MSVPVFLAVLGAALLHAGWNAIVRVWASRAGTMMLLSGVQGVIGIAVVTTQPLPGTQVWTWIVASGAIHSAYKLFLTFAYEHGDLGRVYPLARGTAPMITLVAGALWLGEAVRPPEAAGILLLGSGILLLARGVWTSGESRRMLPFAVGAACATAGYTLVDGHGARLAGSSTQFVGWLFVVDGLIFAAAMLALRGRAAMPRAGRVWLAGGTREGWWQDRPGVHLRDHHGRRGLGARGPGAGRHGPESRGAGRHRGPQQQASPGAGGRSRARLPGALHGGHAGDG